MPQGEPRILLIADDFGLDAETNEAILHSHRQGALHGAALMMGQPGTEEAVKMAREFPALQIGLHLHWNDSIPLTVPRWPWGASPAAAGWSIGVNRFARELMELELQAQWKAFRETGIPCRFLNSHHHLHLHPMILAAILRNLSGEFDGWIRLGLPRCFCSPRASSMLLPLVYLNQAAVPFRSPETLWGIDRTFEMKSSEIRRVSQSLTCGVHEFIFHPRRITQDSDTQCLIELKNFC